MVHREDGVGIIQVFRLKKRVRRERPAKIHPFSAHFFKHRNNGVDLFGAHVSTFSRMRIQAANQNVWLFDAEFGLQVMMQDPDDLPQQCRGDGIRNGLNRQMGGHERNAHCLRRQHHHYFRAVRALFKEFRVPGKGDTRFVDDALVHGAGDQGSKFTLQATVAGAREGFHDVVAVFRAELAWNYRCTKRDRKNRERTGLLWCWLSAFNVRNKR